MIVGKLLIKNAMILFMWYPLRMMITFLPLALSARIGRLGGVSCASSRERNNG